MLRRRLFLLNYFILVIFTIFIKLKAGFILFLIDYFWGLRHIHVDLSPGSMWNININLSSSWALFFFIFHLIQLNQPLRRQNRGLSFRWRVLLILIKPQKIDCGHLFRFNWRLNRGSLILLSALGLNHNSNSMLQQTFDLLFDLLFWVQNIFFSNLCYPFPLRQVVALTDKSFRWARITISNKCFKVEPALILLQLGFLIQLKLSFWTPIRFLRLILSIG